MPKMIVEKPSMLAVSALTSFLAGCGMEPVTPDRPAQPLAFHNTRLTYAVMADDEEALQRDFQMKTRPTWVERAFAGIGLLTASGMETVTWPVFAGFRAWLEAHPEPSAPEYLSGVRHEP
ncbi:hypothetical protein [Methylococcus sp. BF19-07]|nr:hypothetical protein [Methylococcus sp. BF19-07]MDF9393000.1 hypothetical protein [Methylococcus capsulatus]